MKLLLLVLAIVAPTHGSVGWNSGYNYATTLWKSFWDYDSIPPSNWGAYYTGCDATNGVASKTPSPVYLAGQTLETTALKFDLFSSSVSTNYDKQSVASTQNFQNSIAVLFDSSNPWKVTMGSTLTGKDLLGLTDKDEFQFVFMLWKWGKNRYEGSEHTPKTFSKATDAPVIELQMYFQSKTQSTKDGWDGFVAAATASDMIAAATADKQKLLVISIPFQATAGGYNKYVQKFLPYMGIVRGNVAKATDHQRYELPSAIVGSSKTFNMKTLFPSDGGDYKTIGYKGQLTMPPCSQAVWLVTQSYNTMSLGQAAVIRVGVYNERYQRITQNHRAVQNAVSGIKYYKVEA